MQTQGDPGVCLQHPRPVPHGCLQADRGVQHTWQGVGFARGLYLPGTLVILSSKCLGPVPSLELVFFPHKECLLLLKEHAIQKPRWECYEYVITSSLLSVNTLPFSFLYLLTSMTERKLTPSRGRGGGGMNWETGIDICTLLCGKQTTNENLLYSLGNSIQCSLVP